MIPRPRQVPDEAEWAGYEDDLDVRWAHGLLAGKTIEDVRCQFRDTYSIERASELLRAPSRVPVLRVRLCLHSEPHDPPR